MSAGIREEGRGARARKIGRRGEKRTQTELSVRPEPLPAELPPPIPYGVSPRAVSIIQAGLMLNVSRSTIYRMYLRQTVEDDQSWCADGHSHRLADAILEGDGP